MSAARRVTESAVTCHGVASLRHDITTSREAAKRHATVYRDAFVMPPSTGVTSSLDLEAAGPKRDGSRLGVFQSFVTADQAGRAVKPGSHDRRPRRVPSFRL